MTEAESGTTNVRVAGATSKPVKEVDAATSGVRLRIVLVGLPDDFAATLIALAPQSTLVQDIVRATDPRDAAERLSRAEANCILLNPLTYDWRSTQALLQMCVTTYPVCLVAKTAQLMSLDKVPRDWRKRLQGYSRIPSDIAASEISAEFEYVVRGCHTYFLKRIIRTNVRQIAAAASATPSAQLAEKAHETERVLEAIETTERSELEVAMGLNSSQMRTIFDEALTHARTAMQRGQIANWVALATGLLLVVATAIVALVRNRGDAWTFATGGMGAAATIAALVTSPRRSIENGASRLLFIQTAYFSFLTQVRLLSVQGEDTSLQRSERLETATAKLLEQLKSISVDSK